jgi:glycosyltransferase involved in cell wall biosynthesis
MRVLHVVTHHSPDHVFGGPTRVAFNLCRELRAGGDEATVLTVGDGFPRPLPREADGVPVKLFPARRLIPGFGFSGITSPALLARAGAYVRSADLVHVHLARDLVTFPVALSALLARRPLVIQTHGMIDPTEVPAARLSDALGVRRVLRRADRLLYLTETERRGVAAVAAPASTAPAHRLVNGVPAQSRRPSRAERGGPPVVLFLARLEERKRPEEFVAAIPTVRAAYPDASFVLAGADAGGMTERVARLADELGVSAAWSYAGALDHPSVLAQLSRADVYVLPSVYDPFPVSVLEAMSVGLPVVITETNGLAPDVAAAGAGRVVPGGDAADPRANGERLGRAVVELLDERANERASAAAWQLVRERFAIGAVVEELREVYAGVLARHAALP